MVYCVVPRELEADLFERLSRRPTAVEREMRELRDRRRRRTVGEFAPLVGEAAAAG
jgi:hypothetical protein